MRLFAPDWLSALADRDALVDVVSELIPQARSLNSIALTWHGALRWLLDKNIETLSKHRKFHPWRESISELRGCDVGVTTCSLSQGSPEEQIAGLAFLLGDLEHSSTGTLSWGQYVEAMVRVAIYCNRIRVTRALFRYSLWYTESISKSLRSEAKFHLEGGAYFPLGLFALNASLAAVASYFSAWCDGTWNPGPIPNRLVSDRGPIDMRGWSLGVFEPCFYEGIDEWSDVITLASSFVAGSIEGPIDCLSVPRRIEILLERADSARSSLIANRAIV